ncbi:MAG: hypothetical protein OEZ06_09135 [Myxococcales bacterium]|nr:hypothetical protein [Myxococcales bacterium]
MMGNDFLEPRLLGRSGLVCARMGIGSDQGLDADSLCWAFERGINYFYWGSRRTPGMREAIVSLSPSHREQLVVAVQSYDPTGLLLPRTFRRGLSELGLDYADVLILGKRDGEVSSRIEKAVLALKDAGLVRTLCVSAHDRSMFARHLARGIYDLIMVRYNCAHPGAEREVFPLIDAMEQPPGVIVYNATRWGQLFDPAFMPSGEVTPEPTHLYRHALSHRRVDMVLTAPATRAQLAQNLEALEKGPLDDDERAWLARVGRHVHGLSPNSRWDFLFRAKK